MSAPLPNNNSTVEPTEPVFNPVVRKTFAINPLSRKAPVIDHDLVAHQRVLSRAYRELYHPTIDPPYVPSVFTTQRKKSLSLSLSEVSDSDEDSPAIPVSSSSSVPRRVDVQAATQKYNARLHLQSVNASGTKNTRQAKSQQPASIAIAIDSDSTDPVVQIGPRPTRSHASTQSNHTVTTQQVAAPQSTATMTQSLLFPGNAYTMIVDEAGNKDVNAKFYPYNDDPNDGSDADVAKRFRASILQHTTVKETALDELFHDLAWKGQNKSKTEPPRNEVWWYALIDTLVTDETVATATRLPAYMLLDRWIASDNPLTFKPPEGLQVDRSLQRIVFALQAGAVNKAVVVNVRDRLQKVYEFAKLYAPATSALRRDAIHGPRPMNADTVPEFAPLNAHAQITSAASSLALAPATVSRASNGNAIAQVLVQHNNSLDTEMQQSAELAKKNKRQRQNIEEKANSTDVVELSPSVQTVVSALHDAHPVNVAVTSASIAHQSNTIVQHAQASGRQTSPEYAAFQAAFERFEQQVTTEPPNIVAYDGAYRELAQAMSIYWHAVLLSRLKDSPSQQANVVGQELSQWLMAMLQIKRPGEPDAVAIASADVQKQIKQLQAILNFIRKHPELQLESLVDIIVATRGTHPSQKTQISKQLQDALENLLASLYPGAHLHIEAGQPAAAPVTFSEQEKQKLEKELADQTVELNKAKQQLQEVITSGNSQSQALQQTEAKLQETNRQLHELNAQNQTLAGSGAALRQQVDQLHQQINALNATIQHLQTDSVATANEQAVAQIATLTKERDALNATLQTAQAQLASNKTEAAAYEREKRQEIDRYIAQLASLQSQLAQAMREGTGMHADNLRLQTMINQLQAELTALKQPHSNAGSDGDNAAQPPNGDVASGALSPADIEVRLTMLDTNFTMLKGQLDKDLKRVADLLPQLRQAFEELKQMGLKQQTSLDKLVQMLETNSAKFGDFNKKLADQWSSVNDQIKRLDTRIEQLQQDSAVMRTKIVDINERTTELLAEVTKNRDIRQRQHEEGQAAWTKVQQTADEILNKLFPDDNSRQGDRWKQVQERMDQKLSDMKAALEGRLEGQERAATNNQAWLEKHINLLMLESTKLAGQVTQMQMAKNAAAVTTGVTNDAQLASIARAASLYNASSQVPMAHAATVQSLSNLHDPEQPSPATPAANAMQALVVGPTLHTAPAYAAATQNIDRADADREQINAQIHAHQKSKQSLQQTLAETDRFYSTLHADQPTASLPNYLSKSLRELNKPNANGRTSLEQPRLHVNDPAK